MPQEKAAIGVNPQSQIHYTDHLAVICTILDCPLLFIDELDYELGSKYYPGLKTLKVDYHEFDPEYLISRWDVLILSDLWDREVFHQKFGPLEQQYGKTLRHVHCPHGYSDKAFYLMKCAMEDILLIYGQNMIDMLKEQQVFNFLHRYVMTGNYRYTYFKQHRPFYDQIMEKEVLSQFDKKRPIILYAPTWLDLEESTTFFDSFDHILEMLPSDYNMIVKLHPRLELDDAAKYYYILGRYEKMKNIVFLKDFPLIFPLLSISDIYLGDMSSIGYDYLPFDKPMFFLNKQRKQAYLFRCGVEIYPEDFSQLYKIIEKNIPTDKEKFSQIRQSVFEYTFGKERSFSDIKKEIIQAYS